MVAASISLSIRTAMLVVLFLAVFFTVNNQVDSAKTIEINIKLQEVAEYVETKVEYGLVGLAQHGSNSTQYLYLPPLGEVIYTVEISCNNYLTIEAHAEAQRSYIINEFFNCSRIQAGGLIYAGHRCLYTRKINDTLFNITLVNDCALV